MSTGAASPHPSSATRISSGSREGSWAGAPGPARSAMPQAARRVRKRFMVHPYYTANDSFSVETSRRDGVQRAPARTGRGGPASAKGGGDPAARPDDGAPE